MLLSSRVYGGSAFVGTNVQVNDAITRVATIVIIARNCGETRAIAAD